MKKSAGEYNLLTKWLHFGFASSITLTLFLSLVMLQGGGEPVPLPVVAFNLHKIIGLNAMVLTLVYLLWSSRHFTKSLSDLFPWFSMKKLRILFSELTRWRSLNDKPQLAAAVQGSGILVALLTSVTGTWLILGMIEPGLVMGWQDEIVKWHIVLARVMWIYLGVHVSMTLLHTLHGHLWFLKIFSLFQEEVSPFNISHKGWVLVDTDQDGDVMREHGGRVGAGPDGSTTSASLVQRSTQNALSPAK